MNFPEGTNHWIALAVQALVSVLIWAMIVAFCEAMINIACTFALECAR